MWQRGFLPEQVSTAFHTMFQRNGLNGQRTVFVHHLLNHGVHRYEVHLIFQIATERVHLLLHDSSQCCRRIHRQLSRTSQQSEGAQHADESEAMVAMQMGDEDGTDLGKPQS